jgi:hypothetical protein
MRDRTRSTRIDISVGAARRFLLSQRVLGVICWAVAAGLAGCGSSSAPTTTAVPGGASMEAGASAPTYCKILTGSKPLLQLSAAMSTLARDPGNTSAQEEMRSAANAVDGAARQAPASQRVALLRAGRAIRALAAHGLANAPGLDAALTHAGHSLQGTCSFPVG